MKKTLKRISANFKSFTPQKLFTLGKEFSWIVFGQVGILVIGVVGTRLVTELISPDILGQVALGMTVMILSQQIIFGPIANAVSRYFAFSVENKKYGAYYESIIQLYKKGFISLTVIFIILILAFIVLNKSNSLITLLTLYLYIIVFSVESAFSTMQNAARNREIVVFHQLINQIGRYLIIFAVSIFINLSVEWMFIAYSLASILTILSQTFFFKRKIHHIYDPQKSQTDETMFNEMSEYSKPFQKWGLFYWLQSSSDRWSLQLFSSTYNVGLYSILYNQGYNLVSMLSNNMSVFLTPIFFQKAGDGTDRKRISNTLRQIFILSAISLIVCFFFVVLSALFHEQLFMIIVSEEYRGVSYLYPYMIFAGGIFATAQFLTLNFLTNFNTNALLFPKITASIIGVSVNILSTYYLGLQGLVYGMAFTAFSYLALIIITIIRNNNLMHTASTQLISPSNTDRAIYD